MSTPAMNHPTLNSSPSASSISSLKSIIKTPTGTVLRRSSGSSTSIVPAVTVDLAALTSWTSVFENYPPPQVRVVAFQVRNEAQAKREQLRSLVGESYRELLSTADTIIGMNDTVQEMEERFRTLSTGCSSKTVRSRAEKRDVLGKAFSDRDMTAKMSVAIVKIMNDLCFTIETLLRTPELILTVSKLLLVVKELAASANLASESQIGFIVARLSSLESRYFRCVAAILRSNGTSNILDALVSYSLVTASSPSATLSYFLETRTNQLESLFAQTTPDTLLTALGVLDFTITTTNTLFPNQFSRALTRAIIFPALNDEEFRKLPHIDFSFLSIWCPKAILEFIPSQARDPADSPIDVFGRLSAFQASSISSFETGMRDVITMISSDTSTGTSQKQIEDLLCLRRAIFETLIERPAARPLLLSKDVTWEAEWFPTLKSLCSTYLNATIAIADALSEVVINTDAATTKLESNPVSLWDDAWMTYDISRGALDFRSAVTALIDGNASVGGDILVSLQSWWDGINAVRRLVGRVKGVYEYDSFAGEQEPWIRDRREAAEREGQQLEMFFEDEVVPGGISLLVDRIRSLLLAYSADKYKIGILVRVARRVLELPLTQKGVRDLIGGIVEDSYATFAEVVFPVTIGLGEVKTYFSGNVETGLWEEESTGGKYPFDASPWIAEGIYDNYVRPIVGSASEDIVLGFPFGVSVCRRVVGQKWISGISDGIARYLQQLEAVASDSEGLKDAETRIEGSHQNKEPEDVGKTVSFHGPDNKNREQSIIEENGTTQSETNERTTGTTESKSDVADELEGDTTTDTIQRRDRFESSTDYNKATDSSGGLLLGLASSSVAAPQPTRAHWVQLLFDIIYLGKVFSIDVSALRDLVLNSIAEDDDKLLETITKRVESCWKRTYLLYAIM
ncbi:uncharacterized protein V1513DRAFT_451050 [Lipomyces chichibuensis]|uniref:uncharacterized protein n=1 Tax=Lipomyces chichibuensis TaxID=1546026 RepID=UPI0033440193